MKNATVTTLCNTPHNNLKGQEKLYKVLIVFIALLILPGCVTSDHSAPLAPSPPDVPISTISDPVFEPHPFTEVRAIEVLPAEVITDAQDVGFEERHEAIAGLPDDAKVAIGEDHCRIQDRFDRKAVLAYEWGHERLALDVDGIGFDGGDTKGVRVEYRINLQRKKFPDQKCRYSSKWQGLVGSGYNEMFLREDDTMWDDLRDMRKDVSDHMDRLF